MVIKNVLARVGVTVRMTFPAKYVLMLNNCDFTLVAIFKGDIRWRQSFKTKSFLYCKIKTFVSKIL